MALDPATALRRGVVVPLVLAVEACLLAAAPLLLAGAALLALPSRHRTPLRIAALAVAYAAIELRTVTEVVTGARNRSDAADFDLLARFLDRLHTATWRLAGIRVRLAPGCPPPTDVRAAAPLLVLSRHAGPGDSFLVAWLLVHTYGLRPRIVMRSALRLVPVVELLLTRLPNCFVGPRRGRTSAAIAELAAEMGDGDALLLFPEGGNFSAERRRMRIAALRRRRRWREARRAHRMRHVMAPHAGGALAALGAAPDADVLVVAHTGLTPPGADERRWWSLPIGRELVVATWLVPGEDVPAGDPEREQWLYDQWTRVDEWVGAATASAAVRTGA